MIQSLKSNYKHTINACYLGLITQAVVNNFAPLLFIRFSVEFNLSLDKITSITVLNFLTQLLIDLFATKLADKVGYRFCVVFGHFCSVIGLAGLAIFPFIMPSYFSGIILSVIFYAIGGGIIEVLISPIVEACPTSQKEAAMSLLHSFYCWGHVFVVIISTLFFFFAGIENWKYIAFFWALIPLINVFLFSFVPIYSLNNENIKQFSLRELLKEKSFWLFVLIMICSGASEQAISQWSSAFAESALNFSKTIGDIAGPCTFAIFMGLSRICGSKITNIKKLKNFFLFSAILCILSYSLIAFPKLAILNLIFCAITGFSVGIFWPGSLSFASKRLPGGGTAMYALLALAGDLGCSSGPGLVGFIANHFNGNFKIGIAIAMIFPIIILLCIAIISRMKLEEK